MKKKIKEHDCKEHVDTEWRWSVKLDDWEPVYDICTKCGNIIYEY